MAVLSKASKGKDISHSIKRGKLARLDSGIKETPIIVVNPDRNAIVYITNITQGGYPVIAAFDMNAVFDGDSVHKATSIHLQIDVQSMLENLPKTATVYVQNENELEAVGATNNLRGLAANIKFISKIVEQDSEKVKKKNSDRSSHRQQDQQAALEKQKNFDSYSGNMAEKIQQMENELSEISMKFSDSVSKLLYDAINDESNGKFSVLYWDKKSHIASSRGRAPIARNVDASRWLHT